MKGEFIAVDWGTTNRRCYLIDGSGAVVETGQDDRGASFVSGLLIGADVAARPDLAGGDVYLLADPALGALYGAAIEACGGTPTLVDSHAAFVAGIVEIWRMLR